MANTPTTNYAYLKPASGDTGWGTTMNTNLDSLDEDMQGMAQLAGRSGGQTLYGDTAANGDITIHGTSNATRTTSYVLLQPTAGNVGIGTTAPLTKLHVVDTSATAPRGILSSQISADYNGPRIGLSKARGTPGSEATVIDGDMLGGLVFRGYDGSNYLEMGRIEVDVSGTPASTKIPTYMAFSTATNATPSVLTERMRITRDGYVGIGTTAPLAILHVAGSGFFTGIQSDPGANVGVSIGHEGAYGKIQSWYSTPLYINPGGNNVVLNSATGSVGVGTTSPDSKLHVNLSDTGTNTAAQVVTISHNGGTAAAGFGSRILWELESSTTDDQTAGTLDVVWAEATHATRKARAVLTVYDTAARECMRAEASGTAPMISFLGANASARLAHVADPAGGVTVDAEARSAINSILTTLETFGFQATS